MRRSRRPSGTTKPSCPDAESGWPISARKSLGGPCRCCLRLIRLHTRTRELMTASFRSARSRRQNPDGRPRLMRLSNSWSPSESSTRSSSCEVYPMRIFPDMIGLPREGREHLLTYAAATFNAFGPRNELFLASERAAAEATAWVQQACKRANLEPGGWGMEVYRAADEGKCSAEEAERLVRSFLTAGVDTTVNGIAHLMLAFASAPDQWARLRANPGAAQIKKAFEESPRWDSTAQTFFRTTGRDAELTGVPIPAGSKVLLFLGAANRDPRRFKIPSDSTFSACRAAMSVSLRHPSMPGANGGTARGRNDPQRPHPARREHHSSRQGSTPPQQHFARARQFARRSSAGVSSVKGSKEVKCSPAKILTIRGAGVAWTSPRG